jgi:hypothetical protein
MKANAKSDFILVGYFLLSAFGLSSSQLSAQPLSGARYLIIAPDSFVDAIRPLAEWKTRKGVPARIESLSQVGSTPPAIRAFVRNAWQNWPVKPEYLLLAGSPTQIPAYTGDNDCYYGNMTGNYRMELPVGRLPAENSDECRTMVAKTLAYERFSDTYDSSWCIKGTTVICDDDTITPDTLYGPDSRLLRQFWIDRGYLIAESLSNFAGDDSLDATAALQDGRTFITYRGVGVGSWWHPFMGFYPHDWYNHEMMPVIVSATCQTVTLFPGQHMLGDACVRYGSAEELGGSVAYFGTSRVGMHISYPRSACYRGFFNAIYSEGIARLGPATLRGRFRLDSLYQDSVRYEEWTLLGDPELSVRTARPRRVQVSYSAGVPMGPQSFPVQVQSGGAPLRGAMVCATMDSTVYAADTTDAAGQAILSISPVRPGAMMIVVTGPDLRPYEGVCLVFGAGPAWLDYLKHTIHDPLPGGNGDSMASQGEAFNLPVWAVNYGDSTARGVTGILRSADTLVTVLDSTCRFGDIPGHDSLPTGAEDLRLQTAADCPDLHATTLWLECRDSVGQTWNPGFALVIHAPDIDTGGMTVIDSSGNNNGRLDPGETAELVIALLNRGSGPGDQVRAVMRSGDRRLSVDDSLSDYGTIPAGANRRNESDRFRLRAGPMLPGSEIPCTLHLAARSYQTTIVLELKVGVLGSSDPIPDGPRLPPQYWAYDDTDTAYAEHPVFEWLEVRNRGVHLPRPYRDSTCTISLPAEFGPFVYYDQVYRQLSACTDGFLAPGVTSFAGRENARLPTNAAPAMLAPNWDALATILGGGIWCYYDTTGRRFIVEWDSVHYRTPSNVFDKFEVVIYDTSRASRDGNSEFAFQYLTANRMSANTVGIQDSASAVGITALFNGVYHPGARPIAPGRAIKFTTDPPFAVISEKPEVFSSPLTAFSVSPNPFQASVALLLRLPSAGWASVHIYDVSGRRIRSLTTEGLTAGTLRLVWDGRNDRGELVGPGVYCGQLTTAHTRAACKLVKTD